MGNIEIYTTEDNQVELRLDLKNNTFWLTLNQIAELYNRDKSVISRHIKNIFESGELRRTSTVAKNATVQKEGDREVERELDHYNLDVIISVGYRVNSKQGTQFRIWATNVLRKYLVDGYALNQKRLQADASKYQELQAQLKTLRRVVDNESFTLEQSKELLRIITDYADGLDLIDQVDHESVELPTGLTKTEAKQIEYAQAKQDIDELRSQLQAHDFFGNEKDEGFKSALQSIFQSFGGNEIYPSVEEKAANLLYLIIKNHPFTDGNKRIGSFMFIRFLDLNGMLYKDDGSKLVAQNALVAIALLIAQSDSKLKDLMVKLVVNLISG